MARPSASLPGRRVLVVGGRGFVGSHVVHALTKAGAAVHVLGPSMPKDRADVLPPGTGETIGSVDDRETLAQAFAASAATDVVSCAGYGSGRLGLMRSGEAHRDAAMAVNVVGHGRLIEAAREHSVRRLVWTSSTVVYGPAALYGAARVDESAARAPVTFYGLTKSLAEDISAFEARRGGIEVVALRLPLVLGPGLWYAGAAAAFVAMLAASRAGQGHRLAFHDRPIDLMHVTDTADAILTLLLHDGPVADTYNLEGFTARASDLVSDVLAIRPGLDLALEPAGKPAHLFPLVSGERLRRDTGFVARHDRASFVRAMLSGELT